MCHITFFNSNRTVLICTVNEATIQTAIKIVQYVKNQVLVNMKFK